MLHVYNMRKLYDIQTSVLINEILLKFHHALSYRLSMAASKLQ